MVKKIKYLIFLYDSIGALVSAIFLIIIIFHQDLFGMPEDVLYLLLPFPFLFSLLSFIIYIFSNLKWRSYLKRIALINFAYCLLILFLTLLYYEKLTKIGMAYFILEMIVITALATVELKISLNIE